MANPKPDRRIVAGLIALSAVPVGAGLFRLVQLASGAEVTPANARFFSAPLPVVLHIVSASLYCVAGAFQFAPGLRRRRNGWHRAAGRLLAPCGIVAALSGLWLTLFFPRAIGDGDLLAVFRLVFGAGMLLSIVYGLDAIRRRDFARHGAWMMRGYAIGMGAGTQFLTLGSWDLMVGTPGELSKALLMAAAWGINLIVAEWIIRGRQQGESRCVSPSYS